MPRLFKRSYAITFARLSRDRFFPDGTVAATRITDLRVAFEVERVHRFAGKGNVRHPTPNTCSISIWNLAEATRAAFETKPTYVRLEAGYDDQPRRLFEGDITFACSKRDGADWVTEMQLADGGRAMREARVNRSYQGGVSARTALAEIAKAMGVRPPRSSELTELAAQYVSGLTLYGNASRELTRVLAPHGLSWSIQDGRLQILRDTDARPDTAVLVNQDSGLIGSPEFGSPETTGGRPVLSVKTLLHAGIVPGGLVKVESLTANGVFRVDKVQHSGDFFGENWFTTFEARQRR